MKSCRLAQAAVILAVTIIAGATPAMAVTKYRVITEGELGFKRGNTFFALKMTGADFETRFAEECSFHRKRSVGALGVVAIGHLNVIGFMASHHLIARDTVKNGVHNRPLRSRTAPTPFRLFHR